MAHDDPTAEESAGTSLPAAEDLTGTAAFHRQVDAIAEDRGLAPQQVGGPAHLANMPDVTPAAFVALAGIVDCLLDADLRTTDGARTTGRDETDDG